MLLISGLLATTTFDAAAHGPGGSRRGEERAAITEAVDVQETGIPVDGESGGRVWGVSVTTGWESRHVHYGVDESGPSGAYFNEVGAQIGDFSLNVWNGFGLGNDLVEWDFTAAYNFEAGPLFLMPGYNFRCVPQQNENGHEHASDHHGDASGAHEHNTFGNEIFFSVGTDAIPYVIPAAVFIWDLNNLPGAFLEFRLDGEVPLYREIVSVQPYALLGLNLGYNTTEAYGLNNFQFGLQATCKLCAWASFFAGVNYSVPLEALEVIGQNEAFWINAGLSFAY